MVVEEYEDLLNAELQLAIKHHLDALHKVLVVEGAWDGPVVFF